MEGTRCKKPTTEFVSCREGVVGLTIIVLPGHLALTRRALVMFALVMLVQLPASCVGSVLQNTILDGEVHSIRSG